MLKTLLNYKHVIYNKDISSQLTEVDSKHFKNAIHILHNGKFILTVNYTKSISNDAYALANYINYGKVGSKVLYDCDNN